MYNSYKGLLTAITECGLLCLAIRFSSLKRYQFNQIIAFGIAFGAIEAILLGLGYGLRSILIDTSKIALWPIAYSGIVERASALLLHTIACALIFYSIIAKRAYLFWISFAAKGAVDGLASWLILTHPTRNLSYEIGLYVGYVILAAVSSIGLWWLTMRRDRWITDADLAAGNLRMTSGPPA